MILGLLKFINPFKSVAGKLADAYMKKQDAQTEQAMIAADTEIAYLEAKQGVLIAEQRHPITRLIRPMFALPFCIFVWKVVVWDTVLGLGTTPHLSDHMYTLMSVITGAYFLTTGGEKIVKAIKSR